MGRKQQKKGGLIVVSGFSGVGKGTVIRRLMELHPVYAFSVSATTRAPRPGEQDGVDYFFIEPETFDAWVEEDRFLEYARFFDRAYGTLREQVDALRAEGTNVILDIEVEGALNVKKAEPDAKLIYLIPPSAGELIRRLNGRGTETPEQIEKRIRKAVLEAGIAPRYDVLVVNDDIDETAQEIHALATKNDAVPRRTREETLALTDTIRTDLSKILNDPSDCDSIENRLDDKGA